MKLLDNIIINKNVLKIGFALFAMFFGAGNIIFPIYIGAHVGEHIWLAGLAFAISGVGVPFLALIAMSVYKGDYWKFFGHLGRMPSILIITFLLIVIGPLAATPRTGATTFNTLLPYLPNFMQSATIFGIFYFAIVFMVAYKESSVVDIIAKVISPVKIISFTFLFFMGVYFSEPMLLSELSAMKSFSQAINYGYSTMDMLGAFFYCGVVYHSLKNYLPKSEQSNDNLKVQTIISSCIVGAGLIAFVYTSFMYLGYCHAASLRDIAQEKLILATAQVVLGAFGGIFVCISVSFSCLATAIALTQVCTSFLYREIFKEKYPRLPFLLLVVTTSYIMSILGFAAIMNISMPILKILYPCLIVYCIYRLFIYYSKKYSAQNIAYINEQVILEN